MKLRLEENESQDIFIQFLILKITIIPLTLVGYELMIAESVLSKNSCPMHICEIIVNYI